jgi:hypothetical protein
VNPVSCHGLGDVVSVDVGEPALDIGPARQAIPINPVALHASLGGLREWLLFGVEASVKTTVVALLGFVGGCLLSLVVVSWTDSAKMARMKAEADNARAEAVRANQEIAAIEAKWGEASRNADGEIKELNAEIGDLESRNDHLVAVGKEAAAVYKEAAEEFKATIIERDEALEDVARLEAALESRATSAMPAERIAENSPLKVGAPVRIKVGARAPEKVGVFTFVESDESGAEDLPLALHVEKATWSHGYTHVQASVENGDSSRFESVEVVFTAYDAAGEFLDRSSHYLEPSEISPGQTAHVNAFIDAEGRRPSRIEWKIVGREQ